jgi:hypothetical protein
MMTLIHSVCLVAMNHLKIIINVTFSMSMGMPTSKDGIFMQMIDCLQVPDRCDPCFQHTHSTKYFSYQRFQLHTFG